MPVAQMVSRSRVSRSCPAPLLWRPAGHSRRGPVPGLVPEDSALDFRNLARQSSHPKKRNRPLRAASAVLIVEGAVFR